MDEGKADVFLTYCTSAVAAQREVPRLKVVEVPANLQVAASYGLTVRRGAGPAAARLTEYILSPPAQAVLRHYGFGAPGNPWPRVALLPYTRIVRKVLIRKEFLGVPQTIFKHVHKKRLEDGLSRRQVGERIGVHVDAIWKWENGHTRHIPVALIPAVVVYLGYDPEPKPENVGG